MVTTQNVIAGATFTILGGIFFLLFSADNKKHLSQIKTIQTFKLKDIYNIYESIQEEMRIHGYLNMMVVINGFIKEETKSSGLLLVEVFDIKTEITVGEQ